MGAEVMGALRECREKDRSPLSREVLGHIIQNNKIAAKEQVAICQDTGHGDRFCGIGAGGSHRGRRIPGCRTVVVEVCVRGTMDKAAQLAKLATDAASDRSRNADKQYQRLECMALERLNGLGIGAGELGGNTTALAMNIKWYPTHIAGMPVAVNVCCHVAHHCIAPLRDQVSGSACVFCVP